MTTTDDFKRPPSHTVFLVHRRTVTLPLTDRQHSFARPKLTICDTSFMRLAPRWEDTPASIWQPFSLPPFPTDMHLNYYSKILIEAPEPILDTQCPRSPDSSPGRIDPRRLPTGLHSTVAAHYHGTASMPELLYHLFSSPVPFYAAQSDTSNY
jgi:hypothetical protein